MQLAAGAVLLLALALAACHKPAYVVASEAAVARSASSCKSVSNLRTWTAAGDVHLIELECRALVPTLQVDRTVAMREGPAEPRVYACKGPSCHLVSRSGIATDVAPPAATVPATASDPAVAPAPGDGEASTIAPAPTGAVESQLRHDLDEFTDDVLTCTSSDRAAVIVDIAEGELQLSLGGSLAGTPEEACVRAALQTLRIRADGPAPARIVHLLRR